MKLLLDYSQFESAVRHSAHELRIQSEGGKLYAISRYGLNSVHTPLDCPNVPNKTVNYAFFGADLKKVTDIMSDFNPAIVEIEIDDDDEDKEAVISGGNFKTNIRANRRYHEQDIPQLINLGDRVDPSGFKLLAELVKIEGGNCRHVVFHAEEGKLMFKLYGFRVISWNTNDEEQSFACDAESVSMFQNFRNDLPLYITKDKGDICVTDKVSYVRVIEANRGQRRDFSTFEENYKESCEVSVSDLKNKEVFETGIAEYETQYLRRALKAFALKKAELKIYELGTGFYLAVVEKDGVKIMIGSMR